MAIMPCGVFQRFLSVCPRGYRRTSPYLLSLFNKNLPVIGLIYMNCFQNLLFISEILQTYKLKNCTLALFP